MKKVFLFAGLLMSIWGCGQKAKSNLTAAADSVYSKVPAEVVTGDSTYWTVSTLSSVGYVNTVPGPNYNTYKSGGGVIVKFKFLESGRFKFQLYVQANTYGTDTELWTEMEGTVRFTKDPKGQPVFITKAEKGVYRITKNGVTTSRQIPAGDLSGQHSNTYLWERFDFPDDPNHTYLLVVDLDAHPEADINKPGSIDHSWVSKFHIPRKNNK